MIHGGVPLTRHDPWQGPRQRTPSAGRHVVALPRRHAWRGAVHLPRHAWWRGRPIFENIFQIGSNLNFISNLG